MSCDGFSLDTIPLTPDLFSSLGIQISKSSNRERNKNNMFEAKAQSQEFKDNFTDQIAENFKSTTLYDLNLYNVKDLTGLKKKSSLIKKIKSSPDQYYKMVNEEYHKGDMKSLDFCSSIIIKNSDSYFESNASCLLNLQIKNLEQRTKPNRISTTSQNQDCEFVARDIIKMDLPRHLPQSSYSDQIISKNKTQDITKTDKDRCSCLNSAGYGNELLYTINSISSKNHNQGLDYQEDISIGANRGTGFRHFEDTNKDFPEFANNSVINYNPIIYNHFNCCHISASENITTSPDTILENYYYHLRNLQKFYLLYLDSFLVANTKENPEPRRADIEADEKETNENFDNQLEDTDTTEFSLGFMYGKQGWICHSCKNFNFESKPGILNMTLGRTKCNRCNRLPQQTLCNKNESKFSSTEKAARIRKKRSTMKESLKHKNFDKSTNRERDERSGDWTCFVCKNLNFSFRAKCNRCQSSKEVIFKKVKGTQLFRNYKESNQYSMNQTENQDKGVIKHIVSRYQTLDFISEPAD